MPGMIIRMEEIAQKRRHSLLRSKEEFEETGKWQPLTDQMNDHRFLAVADYIKTKDVKIFREHLSKAAGYQLELFERAKAGERISECYVSISAFVHVITALAGGDWKKSQQLMSYLEKMDLGKSKDLARYFHLMFRILICEKEVDSNTASEMKEIFLKKYKSFYGYALAFEAIENKDKGVFEEAFSLILKNHKRIGEFRDSADEVIALWSLALINLARFKGLDVHADNPLVPKELIIQ